LVLGSSPLPRRVCAPKLLSERDGVTPLVLVKRCFRLRVFRSPPSLFESALAIPLALPNPRLSFGIFHLPLWLLQSGSAIPRASTMRWRAFYGVS
jgi:hypothetical protein